VTLPKVYDVTDLESAVSQAVKENKVCAVFHTGTDSNDLKEHNRPTSHHLPSQTQDSSLEKEEISGCHQVAAFVGPEGGWTDKEMELFKKNNFQIYSLGQNILRAETAAIVAVWKTLHNQS
jgi:RsmE family RNA methyltransferase